MKLRSTSDVHPPFWIFQTEKGYTMRVSSIFGSLRRLMPVIVSASLLAASAAARAQDKVTLRRNATVGEVWNFDRSTDMALSQKITANGQAQNQDTKMHQRRVGKY